MLQGVCSRAAPGHALALRLHLLLGLHASRYPIHHIRWDRAASFKVHREWRPHAMQYSRAGLQAKAPSHVSGSAGLFSFVRHPTAYASQSYNHTSAHESIQAHKQVVQDSSNSTGCRKLVCDRLLKSKWSCLDCAAAAGLPLWDCCSGAASNTMLE